MLSIRKLIVHMVPVLPVIGCVLEGCIHIILREQVSIPVAQMHLLAHPSHMQCHH